MDLPAKDSIVRGAHNLHACSAYVSGDRRRGRAKVVTGKLNQGRQPAGALLSLATRRQS